jgi:[acyl-carrier-protein] S-malonyltransferase
MGGVALIFPGQGGQAPRMGEPWRESSGWWVVDRASEVLGEDLADLLLTVDGTRLARTREAQLAVFVTALVAWESRPDLGDVPVLAVAGHSLGQVTALVAAGVLSLDDGVALVARRAELTQAAADAAPGRMAALLGASIDQAEVACAAAPDACWLANDNAPGQVVIAGTPEGVAAATDRAAEVGVRKAVPLKVGGAFHTPLMQAACAPFTTALAEVAFNAPRLAVVGNGDAAVHRDGTGWRARLVEHLVSPVRWRESQLALAELGATTFVEVGGAGALVAMAKRTVPDVAAHAWSGPAERMVA